MCRVVDNFYIEQIVCCLYNLLSVSVHLLYCMIIYCVQNDSGWMDGLFGRTDYDEGCLLLGAGSSHLCGAINHYLL